MNAKQYLGQLEALDARIRNTEEHISDLKLKASGGGSIRYDKDRVQTSLTDSKLERDVVDYVALEEVHSEMIRKYTNAKEKVIEQINDLDISAHIEILFKVYVQYKTLKESAHEMGRSERYVIDKHKEALIDFEKKYAPLKRF